MGCLAKVLFKTIEQRSDISIRIHFEVFSANLPVTRCVAEIRLLTGHSPRCAYFYRNLSCLYVHVPINSKNLNYLNLCVNYLNTD